MRWICIGAPTGAMVYTGERVSMVEQPEHDGAFSFRAVSCGDV